MRRKFIFASDFHVPFHLPQGIPLLIAFIQDFQPDIFVFGGDVVDFAIASKFVRATLKPPQLTVLQEATECDTQVVTPICQALPKDCVKIALKGNHEYRADRIVLANAKLIEDGGGAVSLPDLAGMMGYRKNGVKFIDGKAGNAHITIGPITFMHGERYGINPAKLTMEDWGGPVIFGHSHKESTWRKRSGSGRDEVSLGAGCLAMDPDYKDYTNYTRGFAAGWIDDESNEYSAEHIRLSGNENTYLYSPHGSYSAKYIGNGRGGGQWVAEGVDHLTGRPRAKEIENTVPGKERKPEFGKLQGKKKKVAHKR
jgi:hypothetical protein